MRKLVQSLVLAIGLVTLPAYAETITHHEAKVSIEVPEHWKVKKDGNAITLMDKAEDTAVAFAVVDSGEIKQAAKRLEKHLEKKIKKLKWKKEEKIEINGMTGVALDGDGEIDGTDVDLTVLILRTPNKEKDLIVTAIAEDAKLAKHIDSVKFIFKHLKPAK